MITPLLRLKEGSIVDVVAPASACSHRELTGGIRYLKSLGLKPRVSKKIFGRTKILAHTDEERFKQLRRALRSNDADAIWCVRGGYGSVRLLPELAKLKRPKKFKWLLGFSDITSLHSYLNFEWHWPTLHAPVLARFGRGGAKNPELRDMRAVLFEPDPWFDHKLIALNSAALKKRCVRSSVVGGNMITLQSSLGTPWNFVPAKRILFFEDINERPHRMDRMLTQFEQAGWFNHASAVIFGDMSGLKPADARLLWQDVIPRFAKAQKIPVLKGLKAGHGNLQRTIPLLTRAELELGRHPELRVSLRPAVR